MGWIELLSEVMVIAGYPMTRDFTPVYVSKLRRFAARLQGGAVRTWENCHIPPAAPLHAQR
jgi:hypothetical protein